MSIDFSGAEPRWRWGAQGAGGSTSIPDGWAELRQFGAQGRWLHAPGRGRGVGHSDFADVKTESGARAASGRPQAGVWRTRRGGRKARAAHRTGAAQVARRVSRHRPAAPRRRRGTRSSRAARATASTSMSRRRARRVMLRCPYFDGDIARLDDSRGARASPACATWSSCPARSPASRSRPTSRPASRSSPTTRGPRSRAAMR